MADTIHDPSKLSDEELLQIAAQSIEPYESCGIGIDEYEPETECAVEAYGSELVAFARAAIAADRARAALAEPEPKGPTRRQLLQLAAEFWPEGCEPAQAVPFARAARARWGNHPGSLDSSPQPVPVAERLPGPGDCDAEGRCWLLTVEDDYPQWRLHTIGDAQPGGAMIWVPVDSSPGVMVDCFYTSHWLPAHALPLPQPH